MKKKLIAFLTASTMLFTMSISAYAAQYEFTHKNGTKTTPGEVIAQGKAGEILAQKQDYKIELKDGKQYNLADYLVALKDNPTFTEDQIIEKLNENAAEELKVVSVSAINAKQVEVKFNQAVKALKKSNFVVSQSGDAAGTDRLSDSKTATNVLPGTDAGTGMITNGSDDKTVILTVDNGAKFKNGETITVAVSGIKVGDKTMEAVSMTSVLSDTAVPTIVKAQSKSSNQVQVVFSEPVYNGAADDYSTDIATSSNVLLNNGSVSILQAIRDDADPNALIVTTAADLTVGNEYTVTINPTAAGVIQDYAGYKVMEKASVKFNHKADTTAPSVTAEGVGERSVLLTFDRPVSLSGGAKSNVEFRYGYNASGANKVIGPVVSIPDTQDQKYLLIFPSPLSAGEGTLYIHYDKPALPNKSNVIADGFGNVLPNDTKVTFQVKEDQEAPTATVEYKDATHIDIFFSESVNKALQTNSYALKDPDGENVAITGAVLKNVPKNQYQLTVGDMSEGGNYTLTIKKSITDLSVNENAFVEKDFVIAVPDTKKPQVSSVTVSEANDTLYIYYSEEMGTSAVDKANYRLSDGTNQKPLPEGSSLSQHASTVTIKLPKTLAALKTDLGIAAINKLFVGAVTDKANNQLAKMEDHAITTYAANVNVAFVADSIVLKDKDTVEFMVDREIKTVDAEKIKKQGGAAAITATPVAKNGKTTITATFVSDTFGTAIAAQKIEVEANALVDFNGFKNNAIAAKTIDADEAKPLMKSAEIKDSDTNGKIDQIKVTFSELLYNGSVQGTDFTVEGYTVKSHATVAADAVTLTLEEGSANDTGATPKVTLVGAVEDGDANVSEVPQGPITAKDTIKPTVKVTANQSYAKDGAVVVFTATFSEPMDLSKIPQIELTTGQTLAATNMTQASADGTVWTYTHTMASGGNGVVKAKITEAEDLSANVLLATSDFVQQADETGLTADNTAPLYASAALANAGADDDKKLTLTFTEAGSDRILNALADDVALKAVIQIAKDGSNYNPLAAEDTVQIEGKTVVITFNEKLTTATNKVKIAADAIKDEAGNLIAQSETAAINATTN